MPADRKSPTATDEMIEAALETEYDGSTLRSIVNAQLWHHGAYGNAKALVRSALNNALQVRTAKPRNAFCDPGMT